MATGLLHQKTGLNISEYTDETKKKARPVSSLYSIPVKFRVDNNSDSQYPSDDQDIQTTDDNVVVVENDTDDDSGYDISDTQDEQDMVTADLTDPNFISQNM